MVGLVFALLQLLVWPMASRKSKLGTNPISSSTTAVSILLQFDGSWKPLTDPGMLPTANRLAACAACITVQVSMEIKDDKIRNAKQTPEEQIAAAAPEADVRTMMMMRLTGGKILSSPPTSRSAAVEYEGLLLGLEGLERYLRELHEGKPGCDNNGIPNILDIRIQGDCKTVVEQMSQTARPRKLQDYHRRAVAKLDELQSSLSCRIVFEHIPRAHNVFCDRISALLLWDQQQAGLNRAVQDLQTITTTAAMMRISGDNKSDPSISQSIVTNFVAEHLSLDSLIPYSKRPWMYQCLAGMAAASQDWTSVLSMGEQLQSEVELIWTPCMPLSETVLRSLTWKENFMPTDDNEESESPAVRFFDELLLVEALVYKITALAKLGRAKEAHNLQRRKRFLLSKYSSTVTRIEQSLSAGALSETTILSQSTTDDEEELKDKWPLEVLEWYEDNCRQCDGSVSWGKWKAVPH